MLVSLLFPFFLILLPCEAAPSGKQLLREMAAAEAIISYSAMEGTQQGDSREVARIFRDGRKRRLEWLEPALKRGDVLVDDGQVVWLYHRADNSAVQTKTAPNLGSGAGKALDTVKKGQVDGRPAWGADVGRRTIWIDQQTKARLRVETPRFVTSLRNVQFGAVAASKFVFSPPTGATVTRTNGVFYPFLGAARRAAPWLKAPQTLPAGYTFESAIVDPNGEIWLRYSNGARRFSIFQQKAAGEDVLPAQKVNGGYFWKIGGIRFLATGAPDEAIASLSSSLR